MSAHLRKVERERTLRKIRGAPSRRPSPNRSGPTFARLEQLAQVELERYAKLAGPDWRTDLVADCIRGRSRFRIRYDVLCELVAQYGARWIRHDLRVPWESRR